MVVVPGLRKQHIRQGRMSTLEVIHTSVQIVASKILVFLDIFLSVFGGFE